MHKDEQKIMCFAGVAGVSTWIMDALIDSLVFRKGTLGTVLLTGDAHELYMRSLFMVNFMIFGGLIARLITRRERLERAKIAAERALHDSQDRLHSVMESIADSIYLIDAEYRYLFMNKKHLERLGLKEKPYIGLSYRDFHSPEETQELKESVDRVFKTGDAVRSEHFSRRDSIYFLRTFSPVRNGEGRVAAVTVVSKDINDLKQLEERLRSLSLRDELTGLYNRRGFFTMGQPLLKLAVRHKTPVFLLYADLDNLKTINDVLGHHDGDQAIMDVASVFKATFRGTDIIARIGGDEFVVIPVAGKREDANIVLARFKEQISIHNEKNDRAYKLSISVGMSSCGPDFPRSLDDLLKQAEKLMYEEKMLKQYAG